MIHIPNVVESTHYDGCWRAHIECAHAAIVSANARIAELEKDAARYRWLRDVAWDEPEALASDGDWCFDAKNLDKIVDAAMNGEPFDWESE